MVVVVAASSKVSRCAVWKCWWPLVVVVIVIISVRAQTVEYGHQQHYAANNEHDWSEEAHDGHALDHHHDVGVCGGIGQHRHDEARHEQREAQVGEDEQRHLPHPRLFVDVVAHDRGPSLNTATR